MLNGTNVIYLYDGTLDGLLSCVFECFLKREMPVDILAESEYQPTLYESRFIETDLKKARRVENGIIGRASETAFSLVVYCFCSCRADKERLIIAFVEKCMAYGREALSMLTDDVCLFKRTALSVSHEAHQLKGFVRFSISGGVMTAVIEPKNSVLVLLAPHFCNRFVNEAFMIYDKTHGTALVYRQGQRLLAEIDGFEEPEPEAEELEFRALWKMFYDTVAIKERENPRCRMSHMQKRYWAHLTEMKELPDLSRSMRLN